MSCVCVCVEEGEKVRESTEDVCWWRRVFCAPFPVDVQIAKYRYVDGFERELLEFSYITQTQTERERWSTHDHDGNNTHTHRIPLSLSTLKDLKIERERDAEMRWHGGGSGSGNGNGGNGSMGLRESERK